MCKNIMFINCYRIQKSFLLLILKWCLREAAGFNSPQEVLAWGLLDCEISLQQGSSYTCTDTGWAGLLLFSVLYFPVISSHFLPSNECAEKEKKILYWFSVPIQFN